MGLHRLNVFCTEYHIPCTVRHKGLQLPQVWLHADTEMWVRPSGPRGLFARPDHRCTLALCTHSLQVGGVWGSCPSRLPEQLFLNSTGEWACTPISDLWSSPGLRQRNYLAIWQTSADAQEASWGEESTGPEVWGPPHPSGKAACLVLKRKGTFAPSSQSAGASVGLKPIKASCVKWRAGGETLIIMTRKNTIKKNKEKRKTDPIWEANEIQMQNRPLRSVCCKAAVSGAAFMCRDAVPLGPPKMPFCSAAWFTMPWTMQDCDQHQGCWLAALADWLRSCSTPSQAHMENNLRSARPHHSHQPSSASADYSRQFLCWLLTPLEMSYCPPPLPLGRPHGCPFVIPLLTLHFPFFIRSSPSPAPSAHPTCALQAVPELQPNPYSQAPRGSLQQQGSFRGAGTKHGPSSALFYTPQEWVKFSPCASHIPRLTHNVPGSTRLKVSSLFLLIPQLFLPLLSRHKDSPCNGCSLCWWCWWSFIHRMKNWRIATWLLTSVGCAPKRNKTHQILRDRWLKGGSVCPALMILSKTHSLW